MKVKIFNKKLSFLRQLISKYIRDFILKEYQENIEYLVKECHENNNLKLKSKFKSLLLLKKVYLEKFIIDRISNKENRDDLVNLIMKNDFYFENFLNEIFITSGLEYLKIDLNKDIKMIFGLNSSFQINKIQLGILIIFQNLKYIIQKSRISLRNMLMVNSLKEINFKSTKDKSTKELKGHIRNESIISINPNKRIFTLNIINKDSKFFKNISYFVELKKMLSCSAKYSQNNQEPLFQTALEIIKNRNLKYSESFLKKHYLNYDPLNYGEVLELNKKNQYFKLEKQKTYYPWIYKSPNLKFVSGIYKNEEKNMRLMRFYKIKNLIDNIEKYGYVPSYNSLMQGYILNNGNDYRFIITQGWHRLAVLKAFNTHYENKFQFIPIKFDKFRTNGIKLVTLKDINFWPGVRNNNISKKDAKELFIKFFD